MATLQNNRNGRDHTFQIIGIQRKEITATPFRDQEGDFYRVCSESFLAELDHCTTLMSQPGRDCIGMGGDIEWTDTRDEKGWRGIWTCKKCGHAQRFSFSPNKTLCVSCEDASCRNYGYIRISRRLE
jgi:hypothetical protein